MKKLILHTTSLYAAVIIMIAGIVQYSHHHHHSIADVERIVFVASDSHCHQNHDGSTDSTHCGLHLAQMLTSDKVSLIPHLYHHCSFDCIASNHIEAEHPLAVTVNQSEVDSTRMLPVRKKIFNDSILSRGSPYGHLKSC